MVEPLNDSGDDKAVLRIGLKNCDAHDDGTGEPANGDFRTYSRTWLKAPKKVS